MGRATDHSDVAAVRDATDLVRLIGEHIALKPRGREHVGLCPFHDDKNPSFAVVTHKGNAFYKCHACGAGGDVFDFVMNYQRMEFGEALRYLAERAGIKLTPRRPSETAQPGESHESKLDLRKANAFAAAFFQRTLSDEKTGAAAREVIAQRSISEEMVQAFMIGAAPQQWDGLSGLIQRRNLPYNLFLAAGLLKPRKESEGFYDAFRNRLMFPICDDLGNPIAFGGRKINSENEPKYLNSAESSLFSKSRTLYGLHRAKRAIIESRQAIVTEGYTDVIACHQAGICNVVGTLGTALTREHARILSKLCDTVVLVFDGDEAGMKAADRGVQVFFAETVDVKVCALPDELDPDELLKSPDGKQRFERAIASAVDALEYKLQRFQSQFRASAGLSARQKQLEMFIAELAQLGFGSLSGIRRAYVVARISELAGVNIAEIEAALKKHKPVAVPREAQPSIELDDSPVEDAAVTRARRMAERDALAILLFEPAHAMASAMIADLLQLEFADDRARDLAERIKPFVRNREAFTLHDLFSEQDAAPSKSLATELYFVGQRLCETFKNDASAAFDHAASVLQACIHREAFCAPLHDQSEPALAAAKVIEDRARLHKVARTSTSVVEFPAALPRVRQ